MLLIDVSGLTGDKIGAGSRAGYLIGYQGQKRRVNIALALVSDPDLRPEQMEVTATRSRA